MTPTKWSDLTNVLFICHGNICRSTMAEYVMKHLVGEAGLEGEFYIDSAATSTEELGNGIYPPARRKLGEKGVALLPHVSVQITKADYGKYDHIIGMDSANIRNILRICGGDAEGKVRKLMDLTDAPGDVADPWYTGDFEATWVDVKKGCEALLAELTR